MVLMRKYRTLLWKYRAPLQRKWTLEGYQVAEGPKIQREILFREYMVVSRRRLVLLRI